MKPTKVEMPAGHALAEPIAEFLTDLDNLCLPGSGCCPRSCSGSEGVSCDNATYRRKGAAELHDPVKSRTANQLAWFDGTKSTRNIRDGLGRGEEFLVSQSRRRFLGGALLAPIMVKLGAGTADATETHARKPWQLVRISGGWIDIALTARTVALLCEHGITFTPIAPATALDDQDGQIGMRHPINTGQVTLDLTGGGGTAGGGITFSNGEQSLTWTDFTANLLARTISATVNGSAGPQTDVFTFKLLDAQLSASLKDITLNNLKLRLTQDATDTVASAFGAPVFTVDYPYAVLAGLGTLGLGPVTNPPPRSTGRVTA